MRKPFEQSAPTTHLGAVLPLAMMFALMLAIIATTVMQTAVMQWFMAGNNQFVEEAFLTAQAVATELSLEPTNFPLTGDVGYTNCPLLREAPGCDLSQLATPLSAAVPVGVELDYRVIRQDPLLLKGFPIRESEDAVSSSDRFDAAMFEIDVLIDGSETRLGSAHLVQGMAVRVAAFH